MQTNLEEIKIRTRTQQHCHYGIVVYQPPKLWLQFTSSVPVGLYKNKKHKGSTIITDIESTLGVVKCLHKRTTLKVILTTRICGTSNMMMMAQRMRSTQ